MSRTCSASYVAVVIVTPGLAFAAMGAAIGLHLYDRITRMKESA